MSKYKVLSDLENGIIDSLVAAQGTKVKTRHIHQHGQLAIAAQKVVDD
jgi:hypothetical protein